MTQKNMWDFDPQAWACTDVALWRTYYNHRFVAMFWHILQFSYRYWRPNILSMMRYAYHSARAAVIFRKTKGHETPVSDARITEHLRLFYDGVRRKVRQPFDPAQAAAAELAWWYVDRYPDTANQTRQQAFAHHAQVFYGLSPEASADYCQARAAAMELLADYHFDVTYTVDWRRMETLLTASYTSLQHALRVQYDVSQKP